MNLDHLQAGCRAGCRVRCQGRCRARQDTRAVHLAVTVLWGGAPFLQKPISPADADTPLRNVTGSPSCVTSSVIAADQQAHQHPVYPYAQCQADTLHRASSSSAASRALPQRQFPFHCDCHLHTEFFLSISVVPAIFDYLRQLRKSWSSLSAMLGAQHAQTLYHARLDSILISSFAPGLACQGLPGLCLLELLNLNRGAPCCSAGSNGTSVSVASAPQSKAAAHWRGAFCVLDGLLVASLASWTFPKLSIASAPLAGSLPVDPTSTVGVDVRVAKD